MQTAVELSQVKSQRVRRLITACAFVLAYLALPHSAMAQDMEVPVSIQIPLFLKVISFDRQRNQQADLVVGVAYQSGFHASITARDEVERVLRNTPDRTIRVVPVDLDRDALNEIMSQQHVTLLYVAPLRAYSIADIAAAAASVHATTITGVPQYVEQGLSVGARLQGERPKLLVNLAAARRSGANFTAELLKLAQVLE